MPHKLTKAAISFQKYKDMVKKKKKYKDMVKKRVSAPCYLKELSTRSGDSIK